MELRKLKAFLAVCRYGNVTRAAESLFISQPALSRQIQDLEEEMGCALLDRSRRQIALTPKGLLFQIRARELLELASRAKAELAGTDSDRICGTIRVGCVESKAAKHLARAMKRFREAHPDVLFELYSADGDDLRFALDEDRIDMALLLEPVEAAKYLRKPLPVEDRWAVAVRAEDAPKDRAFVTREEAAALPLILPRRAIVVEDVVSWLGVDPEKLRPAGYHNLPMNALELVREGAGALLCAEGSVAGRSTEGIALLPIKPEQAIRHVLVRRKNRELTPAAEHFWEAFPAKA